MGEMRNTLIVSVEKGKKPLGQPRHRWEDIRISTLRK
jgi:hypothetical protein